MVYVSPNLEYESVGSLLFGQQKSKKDVDSWFRQGFVFSSSPNYGLLQTSSGPCGVLVAVQAYLLKHLLFKTPSQTENDLNFSQIQIEEGLIKALAEIITNCAGDQKNFKFVKLHLKSAGHETNNEYACFNSYTHEMVCDSSDRTDLEEKLLRNMDVLKGDCGVISFVYSAILTRGMENVKNDVDNKTEPLIKQFGYCCQELVNLMITGKAVSNVFDGTKKFDESNTEDFVLKGISSRAKIGFLSTFESTGFMRVGEYLKTPFFPIWIIGSMSHYTVLFSLETQLTYLSETDSLRNEMRTEFNKIDTFESGFIECKRLPVLMKTLRLTPAIEKLVCEEINERCNSDTLLFDEFFEALMRAKGRVWNCGQCTLINARPSDICSACQAKAVGLSGEKSELGVNKTSGESLSAVATATFFHYNGMDSMRQGRGKLSRFKVHLDRDGEVSERKESIRGVLKTKWPESKVEFEEDEKGICI